MTDEKSEKLFVRYWARRAQILDPLTREVVPTRVALQAALQCAFSGFALIAGVLDIRLGAIEHVLGERIRYGLEAGRPARD